MIGKAFRCAFPKTLPILAGFGFLGMSYGIVMQAQGFPFWLPILISLAVFGGSLQFVMVTMLLSTFSPLSAFLMVLMIQARHIFYGIAMLEKYKGCFPLPAERCAIWYWCSWYSE